MHDGPVNVKLFNCIIHLYSDPVFSNILYLGE